MAKLVSKTYGEALFETAMEGHKEKELLTEIQAVSDILKDNPEFDKLMKHPSVPKQEKIRIMEQIFQGRVSDELAGFLRVVVDKERYKDLGAIFQYFIDKVKEVSGIGIAYVSAATELSDAQKESVKARLLETTSYKTMEMHYRTDASLIGGMVIRIGDRVVDSSIRTKLNDLTKQLLQIQLG
ncbi:MAG: ATP synthase F1 subunit delta [Candidatus Gastranaerophilales bacterium]|nr:ATP synthase F1 subunit delta [Candidatus Gastranaerophilales bacterium]